MTEIGQPPLQGHQPEKFNRTEWMRSWWCLTSSALIRETETKLLSYVKRPFQGRFIPIKHNGEDAQVWTLSFEENSGKELPLVLVHGMGAGVALWALNLGGLSQNRAVYAMDLLGFGRSSRPCFSNDAEKSEMELVDSLEEWRKGVGLDRFILLGHSMGGFIVTSYAIKYPERVVSLIVADPWGYPEQPSDFAERYPYPRLCKFIDLLLQVTFPYWSLRALGPIGPLIVGAIRPDLTGSFDPLGGGACALAGRYIYHCNAQKASGEAAFHWMKSSFGWAKRPMVHRLNTLHSKIPLHFIHGEKSWVDQCSLDVIEKMRPNSFLEVVVIPEAGHHVYADTFDKFNTFVLQCCSRADLIEDRSAIELDKIII